MNSCLLLWPIAHMRVGKEQTPFHQQESVGFEEEDVEGKQAPGAKERCHALQFGGSGETA